MKRLLSLAWLGAIGLLPLPQIALAGHAEYDALVAKHAKANSVPEVLVHRVIVRESRYRPDLVGRGGTIGLMQIKLPTARGLGYTGDAEGLRDPNTNLTYGVKYLAGAYRAANGDHDRAVHYFAAGYYYAAKQQRLFEKERLKAGLLSLASARQKETVKADEITTPIESANPEAAKPEEAVAKPEEAVEPKEASASPLESAAPEENTKAKPVAAAPKPVGAKLKHAVVKPKAAHKKLADAEARVPRPPAGIPNGANAPKLR